MIKFCRQHKFYETELCPKLSNKHPWKVKFLSLENVGANDSLRAWHF